MIKALKRFNWLILIAMLALIAIGSVAIWSAGNARSEAMFHDTWISNLTTAFFGLVLFVGIASLDYRKVLDFAALPGYVLAILLLVLVLIFGSTVYGGRRWLWFFQPSEISKVFVIALFSSVFGAAEGKIANLKGTFRGFLLAMAMLGLPALLILCEPDLGTTVTLVPACLVMMLAAGVWHRGLVITLSSIVLAAMIVFGMVYEAEKPGVSRERRERIERWIPLKPHQIKRVKVFLFPDEDLMGAGYNLHQAKISIGSGGMNGKGIGKGETNHLKYLPQAISMNDFIFCVYAEETGFLGTVVLIALFALLLLPCCYVAYVCEDDRGRLLSLGVAMLIFSHVYINIAMSIGLVPITGLPLPFISAGRTFLITVVCALGLVESVAIHCEKKMI